MIRVKFVKCMRCGKKIEWLEYNKHIKKETLEAEKEVRKFIKKEKLFATREILELTRLPYSQVSKILGKLMSEKAIEPVGIGVWRAN